MPTRGSIKDTGTTRGARVTNENALLVSEVPLTAKDYVELGYDNFIKRKVFSETFKNSAGSPNQNVDGSVTPVEFTIDSEADLIKSVCCVRFILESTQMNIAGNEARRYGAAASSPGLTNGVEFYSVQGGVQTDLFITPVQSVIQYYYYTGEQFNETGAVAAGVDVLIASYHLPVPILITPGTTDKLVVKISDDLTAMTDQFVIGQGYSEVV